MGSSAYPRPLAEPATLTPLHFTGAALRPPSVPRSTIPPSCVHENASRAVRRRRCEPTTWPLAFTVDAVLRDPRACRGRSSRPPASTRMRGSASSAVSLEPTTWPLSFTATAPLLDRRACRGRPSRPLASMRTRGTRRHPPSGCWPTTWPPVVHRRRRRCEVPPSVPMSTMPLACVQEKACDALRRRVGCADDLAPIVHRVGGAVVAAERAEINPSALLRPRESLFPSVAVKKPTPTTWPRSFTAMATLKLPPRPTIPSFCVHTNAW